jgi:hypothetical protein
VIKTLLQAEKILTHDNTLICASEYEIFNIARRELCEKIIDEMISKGLVKIEVSNKLYDDFGQIVKVRASTRVYNPDD